MKLARLLLILNFLFLVPALTQGQSTNPRNQVADTTTFISLQASQQPLAQVLVSLQNQYKINFFYRPEWLENKQVTITLNQVPLRQALPRILEGQALDFIIYHPKAVVIIPNESNLANSSTDIQEDESLVQSDKVVIGDRRLARANKKLTLKGYVKDKATGEPVIGANVVEKNQGIGAATDKNGFYSLVLTTGHHQLTFSSIGYDNAEQVIALYSNGTYDQTLVKSAVQLSEVEIKSQQNKLDNLAAIQAGVSKVDLSQIKKLPAFMGEIDVVKTLKLMPGVSSIGEAASGFNVRGGNVDQNLILMDEAPIFNSSHLFGFFSVFNPDALQDITLYRGGIPAQYGGRISSVLEVKQKEGNFEKWQGNGGVGPITGRLALQGPIIKNKTSVLIAGRSSYSDWLLHRMRDPELKQSSASFYDVSAKVSHKLSSKDKISLTAYSSQDKFGFARDTIYNWRNQAASLLYGHNFTDKFFLDVAAVYSNYDFRINIDEVNNASVYKNGIRHQSLKANFTYLTGEHEMQFGGTLVDYLFSPGSIKPNSSFSQIIPINLAKKNAREGGIFINDEFNVTPRLSVMAGLRFSIYQQLGPGQVYNYAPDQAPSEETITDTLQYNSGQVMKTYGGLEPRLSVRYRINENASFKAGYNRIRQYIHLVSNTAAASPVDTWTTSSAAIRPQIGDQISLGFFQNLAQNVFETSAEIYYKDIQNILDYKNGATIYLNQNLEADLLQGKGRAYGAEFTLNKKSGRLSGWANYTYSRIQLKMQGQTTETTINKGQYYPANYEKPHTVNVVSNYQFNKRVNFGANFTYSTGRPISAPVSFFQYDVFSVPNYALRNQYRIPDYHRLDLSIAVQTGYKKDKKWEGSWNFSIYNVYGRKNAYSVFFKKVYGSPAQPYRLAVVGTILPSVTYDFKF
ncbi:TonB-dependent receptor [Adhaeribacter swui]|uniref:TonB-dependent receptor n=1 Tax=Adhaeribacter swui TaxID=2086471 RepID=A0A7G7GCP1_9BACT|nr:TonB-dependent receptor [Adhaeribacter swui]QNF34925.1 TonB-dependent receptor [Adhaeribacter swui]